MNPSSNKPLLAPLLLILLTIILWIPTRNIPYWWDSADFVIKSAHNYVTNGFLPLNSPYIIFARPTLFILILASFWKIFGESLFISHFVSLLFTLITIIYTYLIGKALFKDNLKGTVIGFSGSLLVLITPVFLAQVGIIYLEIPIAGLAAASYYYLLKQKYIKFAITTSALVLMKEVGILIALILIASSIISFIFEKKSINAVFTKKLLYICTPIIIFLAWLLYYYFSTGYIFTPPQKHLVYFNQTPLDIYVIFLILQNIFFAHGRAILTVFAVISFFSIHSRKKLPSGFSLFQKSIIYFPLVIIPVILGLFYAKIAYLDRYAVTLLPFIYLASLSTITLFLSSLKAAKNKMFTPLILVLLTLITSITFISNWDKHRHFDQFHFIPLEDNLEYINITDLGIKVSNYLSLNYKDKNIYGAYPFNYMLTETYQHYVTKPLRFNECSKYKKGDVVDIIIFHLYSPGEISCLNLATSLKYSKTNVFKNNGKEITLITK